MKKRKKPNSKTLLCKQQVLEVITDEWQSCRLIALQVILPPDAISRQIATHVSRGDGTPSAVSLKTQIVARRLACLVGLGLVEKRAIAWNRNEYRLTKNKMESYNE